MTKDSDADDVRDDHGPRRSKRREYAPREPRPIDAAGLQELALGYAARYATTAAKLRRYLATKLRDRQWTPAEAPDIDALIARITELGYVNDRAFATLKARAMAGRGLGTRRVAGALAAAGVGREDAAAALHPEAVEPANPYASAIEFARRKRLGPFAREISSDPARQRRDLAAMARGGHDFAVARRVLAARDEAMALRLLEDE